MGWGVKGGEDLKPKKEKMLKLILVTFIPHGAGGDTSFSSSGVQR